MDPSPPASQWVILQLSISARKGATQCGVKRSGKAGSSAKEYPALKNGYEDDDETRVTTWNRQVVDGLTGVFSDKVRKVENNEAKVKELLAKIGKLSVGNNFRPQGLKSG